MDTIFTIIQAAALIIAAASLLANLTPTDADNKFLAKASKLIDFLALNWKKP